MTTARDASMWTHVPVALFALLIVLSLACGFFAGLGMSKDQRPNKLHVVTFAAVVALTAYVIVNIEFPRVGLTALRLFDTTPGRGAAANGLTEFAYSPDPGAGFQDRPRRQLVRGSPIPNEVHDEESEERDGSGNVLLTACLGGALALALVAAPARADEPAGMPSASRSKTVHETVTVTAIDRAPGY